MKRILITGAGSYIGTHIEKWLNQFPAKYEIHSVCTIHNEWNNIDFSGFDSVINVAGIAHVKIKKSMKELFYRVNRDMAISICEKAKLSGVKQYVFLSSMNVYGDKCGIVRNKEDVRPSSFYGDSKLQADVAIQQMNDTTFSVASIRPPAIYGKGCKGNFPTLVRYATKLPVFPNYKQRKSMIYIDNLCELIRLIIDNNDRGIFCPQNSSYTSTSEMVREIALNCNHKIRFTRIFNPLVWLGIKLFRFVNRAFADDAYDPGLSNHYEGKYNVVDFKTSIKKTI